MEKSNCSVPSIFDLAKEVSGEFAPDAELIARLHRVERQQASRKSEFLEALVLSVPAEWQATITELAILAEDHRRTFAYLLEHQTHWAVLQAESGASKAKHN